MVKLTRNKAFRDYIHDLGISLHAFSQKHNIPYSTVRQVYAFNRNPHRPTAVKLVKASGGKLKLSDFGLED